MRVLEKILDVMTEFHIVLLTLRSLLLLITFGFGLAFSEMALDTGFEVLHIVSATYMIAGIICLTPKDLRAVHKLGRYTIKELK